jgi:NAD+ synthase (glutamine-hydrolysing)
MLCAVGLPVDFRGSLYNCAAVLYDGALLGLVPKVNIPNYGEFYEKRNFVSGGSWTRRSSSSARRCPSRPN